jgi:hypothetical protein
MTRHRKVLAGIMDDVVAFDTTTCVGTRRTRPILVWTAGEHEEAIPPHREIHEDLARAILRRTRKQR